MMLYSNETNDQSLTIVLPRTLLSKISLKTFGSSSNEISLTISSCMSGLKSSARRCQTFIRFSIGHLTESMPSQLMPLEINGSTDVDTSVPPVNPLVATDQIGRAHV